LDFANQLASFAGANSGIGYATTKVLANASPDFHVIMAGRSLDKLQTAKTEIEAAGIKGSLSTVQLDVTDKRSIEKAAEEVEKKHGHLDALVNNAGIGSGDVDLKTRLTLCFNTNVIGPAMVSEAFRPLLFKSQNPYSVFVSSGVGSMTQLTEKLALTKDGKYDSLPNEEAYRSSKSALNMIAIIEARDFGPKGLKVFPICPGFVVSNLRGDNDEARSGWGHAGDPADSGNLVLSIVEGKRDADVGKLVHKDGVYPW
jgi:NAD(P)-dependent dehydrogenase (short-subunit alcohol dehydrogenase family)